MSLAANKIQIAVLVGCIDSWLYVFGFILILDINPVHMSTTFYIFCTKKIMSIRP